GWLDSGRMWHVEVNVPHFLAALLDHQNFLGRLDDKKRVAGQEHVWDPTRYAGRACLKGDLSMVDLVSVLPHRLLDPWLEIGIGKIANPPCRPFEGVSGVLHHRRWRTFNRRKRGIEVMNPSAFTAGKIGRGGWLCPSIRA